MGMRPVGGTHREVAVYLLLRGGMWMVLSPRWGPLAFCKGAWRFLLRRVQHVPVALEREGLRDGQVCSPASR